MSAQSSAAAPTHPSPSRQLVSLRALWFGIFGAPAAWSIQMLADYATNAHACFPRLVPLAAPVIGAGWMWMPLVMVSAAALLVGIAALATAGRSYRATRDESEGQAHQLLAVGEGRTRFMALAGVLMSATARARARRGLGSCP